MKWFRIFRSSVFCLLFLLSTALLFSRGILEQNHDNELVVAAIQFEINETRVQTFQHFHDSVTTLVNQAVDSGAQLIVFPEYTNVFLSLLPYAEQLTRVSSIEELMYRIIQTNPVIDDPKDFFFSTGPWVRIFMDMLYGELAARHEVTIVAGTYFHGHEDHTITNRLVVYGTKGEILHQQDKVFLTDFEQEVIGLTPGSMDLAQPVTVQGLSLGFTICRDAFFPVWDQWYSGADVLIDVKAENVEIEEQDWDYVSMAIPERVEQTEASYGLTVHLVGEFLDLFWEGHTSVYNGSLQEITRETRDAEQEEVLLFTFNLPAKNE